MLFIAFISGDWLLLNYPVNKYKNFTEWMIETSSLFLIDGPGFI